MLFSRCCLDFLLKSRQRGANKSTLLVSLENIQIQKHKTAEKEQRTQVLVIH